MLRGASALMLFCPLRGATADVSAQVWPQSVILYRELLVNSSKDTVEWARVARELREWMQANDGDYPLYHFTAPEGWCNDPNGVTYDPATGLYHRFFQYGKTWNDECNPRWRANGCDPKWPNPLAITWGHTISRDLAVWEDWPGIDADSPWDHGGAWSGNCVFDDDGHTVCIYSGFQHNACDVGVCARSTDWIHWEKAPCMTHAPSRASQVNHDTSIWRDGPGGKWYLLIGGCTYAGGNVPKPGVACQGNAQLWSSFDLRNFTYEHPITPGGPYRYWELPYVLPFTRNGDASDNYHHNDADVSALLFGDSNAYWVGAYNSTTKSFVPSKATGTDLSSWPPPKLSDSHAYYSFNPHATDNKGAKGATRRLMFGWVLGDVSTAVQQRAVPYWQSAHSLARLVTVRGDSIVQLPAPELSALRAEHFFTGPVTIASGRRNYLPQLRGDALEIIASFNVSTASARASTDFNFGLQLRIGGGLGGVNVSFAQSGDLTRLGVGAQGAVQWDASILPLTQRGTLEAHVFLDRSIIEVYCRGAAYTARSLLPSGVLATEAVGVDLWSLAADAQLVKLDAWRLRSMWGQVPAEGASSDGAVYV